MLLKTQFILKITTKKTPKQNKKNSKNKSETHKKKKKKKKEAWELFTWLRFPLVFCNLHVHTLKVFEKKTIFGKCLKRIIFV